MLSFAHSAADAINPLFAVLLLAAPLIGHRPRWGRIVVFWAASAVGLAVSVLLAEAGKRCVVLPGHPSFPSGHETFALSCATSLVCWRTAYAFIAAPLVLLIGWALVTAHYHEPLDIFGALITGPWPALLCHAWRWQRARRAV